MRKQVIYLVGPITGCSYEEATEERNAVKAELEEAGLYHCLTPMRGKEHLGEAMDLSACIPEKISRPGCTNHDIVKRDSYDCHRSDVLFVNLLGAKIVSIGSMFEIAWGHKAGKQVVTIMEPGNIHEHLFVKECSSIIFPTVELGVLYLKEVLNA